MNAIEKSKSIRNGLRKGFQDGTSKMAQRRCYGYDIGPDGNLTINPDEAATVRWIFDQYLSGSSLRVIATSLKKNGVLSPAGKPKWNREALNKLLLYGDNVFEKDGINRDRPGEGEKTRYLQGKTRSFSGKDRNGAPPFLGKLERRASTRSASFFHALTPVQEGPGRRRAPGRAIHTPEPENRLKWPFLSPGMAGGPLGPAPEVTAADQEGGGLAALEQSIADAAPKSKARDRANGALKRAENNGDAVQYPVFEVSITAIGAGRSVTRR